jgi:photoactive yellow protein
LQALVHPTFETPDLIGHLRTMAPEALDRLDFGVIGFGPDAEATVTCYNATEQQGSGLSRELVVGLPLFSVVAQCMNNHLIAQRFEDALAADQALDETLDWVFTLRMRPTPVTLRLLATPGHETRYVAVRRTP